MLDIFRSRLFETTTLTAAINEQPLKPAFIGESGLFTEEGVPTTSVVIERSINTLSIVPVTPRGSPATPVHSDKRKGVPLVIPRLATSAQLMADEVQNVRAFGTNDQLAGVEQLRDAKLNKMSGHIDLTIEYHRIGAIQGLVLDSDGTTVLYDLFDTFGISAAADVDMNLDAARGVEDGGVVRKKIRSVTREVVKSLGGNPPTGFMAFCGDDYFDALADHPEVREAYLNQQAANDMRGEEMPISSFKYGGVTWVNYIGTGSVAIAANVARLVPMGVPDLFITRFGPADYMEAVNTNGLPKYTKAVMDPSGFDRFIEMEAQSNPLNICTRPGVLRKLTLT
jgi:hypothetical protein